MDRIRLDLMGETRKDSVAGKPIDAFPDPRGVCPRRACPRILGYSRRSGGGSLREAKPSRMRLRRRAGTLSMYSLMSLASREPFAREAEDGDPVSRFLWGAFNSSRNNLGLRGPLVRPIDITHDSRGLTIMASRTARRRSPTRTVYLGSPHLASPKKAIWDIGTSMSVMKMPWPPRGLRNCGGWGFTPTTTVTIHFSGQGLLHHPDRACGGPSHKRPRLSRERATAGWDPPGRQSWNAHSPGISEPSCAQTVSEN
jgi:hypothetical protein